MKYIAANFKLNGDLQFIEDYSKKLNKLIKKPTNMLVALPFVYLNNAKALSKNRVLVGAQNLSEYEAGAYTGEISAKMIADVGAQFVLVGHSERRHVFGEINEQIAQKIKQAIKNNLKVVLCVGEKLEDKSKYKSVIAAQLKSALAGVNLSNIIIAYEPVWAIGTGKVATTKDIVKVHSFIKEFVLKNYSVNMPVLYGGSVKPANSAEILKLDVVDGVLVGGASLKPADFVDIYNSQF